jgi:hypothetical protein
VAAESGVKVNVTRVTREVVPEGGAEAKSTSMEGACVFHYYDNYEGRSEGGWINTTATISVETAQDESIKEKSPCVTRNEIHVHRTAHVVWKRFLFSLLR